MHRSHRLVWANAANQCSVSSKCDCLLCPNLQATEGEPATESGSRFLVLDPMNGYLQRLVRQELPKELGQWHPLG